MADKLYRIILVFMVLAVMAEVRAAEPSQTFSLDGNLEDWKGLTPLMVLNQKLQLKESPGNWQGPGDLSGSFFFSTDTQFLWIAMDVVDDNPLWCPRGLDLQAPWWKITYDGDAARIKLQDKNNQSVELFIYPGQYGVRPQVYFKKAEASKLMVLEGAEILSSFKKETPGYQVEVKIPLASLKIKPSDSQVEIELFDSDGPPRSCKSIKGSASFPTGVPVS